MNRKEDLQAIRKELETAHTGYSGKPIGTDVRLMRLTDYLIESVKELNHTTTRLNKILIGLATIQVVLGIIGTMLVFRH